MQGDDFAQPSASAAKLLRFIGVSPQQLLKARLFRESLASLPPEVIFGGGSCARQLAGEILRRTGEKPVMVVDDQFVLSGDAGPFEILPYSEFCRSGMLGPSMVLCGIVQPNFDFDAARQRFRRDSGADLLHSSWNGALLEHSEGFALWSPEHVVANAHGYLKMFRRLGDQQSRQVLAAHLRMRLIGDWRSVNRTVRPPYADIGELAEPGPPWHLVDCGAHNGDSIEWLTHAYPGRWSRISVVEPDRRNLEQLMKSRVVTELESLGMPVDYFPFAVSGDNGMRQFISTGGTSSRLSNLQSDSPVGVDHFETVEAVSLEQLISVASIDTPSLIKLDIEGAEVESCRASIDALEQSQTLVATSAYHSDNDLLDLFQILGARSRRLSLRQYGRDGTDLVLLAGFQGEKDQ